jgi:hypothetical protein
LTVAGADGYYRHDFQPIAVAADEVKDYSYTWVVPHAAGLYMVEASLVPAQLTAYDVVWLDASQFSGQSANRFFSAGA